MHRNTQLPDVLRNTQCRKEDCFPHQSESASRATSDLTSATHTDMAPWGDSKLFFCILFIIGCSTVTVAQILVDCCLSVTNKQIDKRFVVDYHEQARSCSVDATVLVTRLGKKLCVPPKEQQWVKKVIKHVDHLKQRCKKENYKGNRCFGVKPE
ncbi:hypothetical protein XENORESO_018342 [Xenotaenia resolanae]|uniref:Chemokine interleukin-8-like domain-containing protein n=1 Tax=Xenotaenia resolanae TaxID=208358 RepID=A0ABV0WHN5_9TELE